MQKPNGYDEAQEMGTPKEAITAGGHHLIIKQVNETQSKTGKPMVVVLFDFAANDSQAGLMMKEFKADDRADKKWPHRGTSYIMVQDYQDANKTSRSYKTFCTCFEKSNGTQINWTDNPQAWAAQFKDKKIGGCFGLVHDVYNGREIVRTELRWFVTDGTADGCEEPPEKQLSIEKAAELQTAQQSDSDPSSETFINIPDGVEEDLPFN